MVSIYKSEAKARQDLHYIFYTSVSTTVRLLQMSGGHHCDFGNDQML